MANVPLFDTRNSRVAEPKAPVVGDISLTHLHKYECKACPLDKATGLCHPKMEPTGAEKPLVYVLGEAPGADEDEQGEQFVGVSGRLLRSRFTKGSKRIRFNNCIRTRPPSNRNPTEVEIECCRPSIIRDIEKSKPKAILAVGNYPVRWFLGKSARVTDCRGLRYAVRVGKHVCWMYPTYHPAFIGRVQRVKQGLSHWEDVGGEELVTVFDNDIKRVFEETGDIPPPDIPLPETYFKGVTCLRGGPADLKRIEAYLTRRMDGGLKTTVDIETTAIRPYRPGSKILSVSVGNHKKALAFPFDHKDSRWSPSDLIRLRGVLFKFLCHPVVKIAHNAAFELEWFVSVFGRDVLHKSVWQDTQVQAYCLDERAKGQSLDALTHRYLGFSLKGLVPVNYNKLEEEPLDDLLLYNGLDVKYTATIQNIQAGDLKQQGLYKSYRDHNSKTPALVSAQVSGMPIDNDEVERLRSRLSKEVLDTKRRISKLSVVGKFERRFGKTFSPTSSQQVITMFRDVLKRREGHKKGKYSCDKEALSKMTDCKLAEYVLTMRGCEKLLSTYVETLVPTHKSTVIYQDGRIHTGFNSTFTATGRLSSSNPNVQNWPKRKHKEIRACVVPPSGHVMLCLDYGQIEYRVFGMATGDKTVIDSLYEKYDVHMVWAEKILKAYPRAMTVSEADNMKDFRSLVKNQFTFPSFYGSVAASICKNMSLPNRVGNKLFEEFWDKFAGVKEWHTYIKRFYEKNLYVECLGGRRRRAPLSANRVINSPIQGSASDIVVDAMKRLWRKSIRDDKPWLAPVLNVHDDLSFFVPKKKQEEAVEIIIKEMVISNYKWVNVPLAVDVTVGPNWYDQTEIGSYDSLRYN